MTRSLPLLALGLLALSACKPTMKKLIESEKAALAPVRENFLASGEAVRKAPRPDPSAPCTLPPDLQIGTTAEIAFIDSLDGIDSEDVKSDAFSTKLDPHQSDLVLALAWTSDKRPPRRSPPFPYSLLPEDSASDGSIAAIAHAKALKYFIFTRVQERRDDEGVVVGDAHLVDLSSRKVLCAVSAEGKADPNNMGQEKALVKVDKRTGKELGTVRTYTQGDYTDKVSTALEHSLQAAARMRFKLAQLEF